MQIPVTAGRDTADLHAFVGEDGIEYLAIRDGLYMREEGLAFLHGGNSSICTIQPTGYTRWFQLADELAGRILKVSVPEHGAYAVYDANGQRVYHSLVDGDKAVTLPQGGIIAFIGDVGARFEITLITPAG